MRSRRGGYEWLYRVPVLFMVLSLVSCAGSDRMVDPSATVVPPQIYEKPPTPVAEGAIWPGDTSRNLFFEDPRPRQVGDIVTIKVQETATSSQSATTDITKDSDVLITTDKILGLPTNLGIQNFLGMGSQFDPGVNADTAMESSGTGTTTRKGDLTATITAVITEILPGGNFRIQGRRKVTVNNEDQVLVVTGIIRSLDISFDNTISSELIADASISYTGKGVVADQQRVGWGIRILSWIWPF